MWKYQAPLSRWQRGIGIAGAALAVVALLLMRVGPWVPHAHPSGQRADTTAAGPPWVYGHADARFTIVEYADLECPYCKAYFPVLKQWIDAHPEVNWQWHQLPLSMHEPAAMQEARLAECAGEADGTSAFWQTVAWIYQHTGSNGQGLPAGVLPPDMTPRVKACLDSVRPDAVIRTQAQTAAHEGIDATPTLQLRDHRSGRTLTLQGAEEGDALLSAFDWLASAPDTSTPAVRTSSRSVGASNDRRPR